MKRISRVLGVLSAAVAWVAAAHAVTCPDSPNQVSVQVHADARFDNTSQLYIYEYRVANRHSSRQEVDSFSVDVAQPVSGLRAPNGWHAGLYSYRSTLRWSAVQVAEPDRVRGDASLPPSIVQIKPGETLTGFAFKSPRPPGPATYYVTGFAPLPAQVDDDPGQAELMAERLVETCPDLQKKPLELAVSGTTLGPVAADYHAVGLDVMPGSDSNPVNPASRGVTPAALLGASGMDVQQIDRASVRLGQAAARQEPVRYQDVNGDQRLDLVLNFPTADIGVRCFDTVVFVSARLTGGQVLQGYDTISTPGCAPPVAKDGEGIQ